MTPYIAQRRFRPSGALVHYVNGTSNSGSIQEKKGRDLVEKKIFGSFFFFLKY